MTIRGRDQISMAERTTPERYPIKAAPIPQTPVDCLVLVIAFNSEAHIVHLLDSLPSAAKGISIRTIVVDNGSTDNTLKLVRDYGSVHIVEAKCNLGYAGGINLGRRQSQHFSSLLVLNPDVVLQPASIRNMFDAIKDPGLGVVAPMLLGPDGRRQPSIRRRPTLLRAIGDGLFGSRVRRRPSCFSEIVWDAESYCHQHSIDWATGAALLISAACDRAVGPWDERFFLYSEETDYAARVQAADFRVDYLPTARACHSGGGSGQHSGLLALRAVSRVRYMEKHGGWIWPYRSALIVTELARSHKAAHRVALRVLLRRSTWSPLTESLRNS